MVRTISWNSEREFSWNGVNASHRMLSVLSQNGVDKYHGMVSNISWNGMDKSHVMVRKLSWNSVNKSHRMMSNSKISLNSVKQISQNVEYTLMEQCALISWNGDSTLREWYDKTAWRRVDKMS